MLIQVQAGFPYPQIPHLRIQPTVYQQYSGGGVGGIPEIPKSKTWICQVHADIYIVLVNISNLEKN